MPHLDPATLPGSLTPEQEFALATLKLQLQSMTRAEVEVMLIDLIRRMMARDNEIKAILNPMPIKRVIDCGEQ